MVFVAAPEIEQILASTLPEQRSIPAVETGTHGVQPA
jgi:hypothetical protein